MHDRVKGVIIGVKSYRDMRGILHDNALARSGECRFRDARCLFVFAGLGLRVFFTSGVRVFQGSEGCKWWAQTLPEAEAVWPSRMKPQPLPCRKVPLLRLYDRQGLSCDAAALVSRAPDRFRAQAWRSLLWSVPMLCFPAA